MVAATAAPAASSGAGIQSIGSGLTGLVSGLASLQAASMEARQFKMQGVFLGLQASAEKLRARENAIFLRRKFLKNIASSRASLSARGVSTGSGIGREIQVQDLKTLGEDLQANELNSQAAQSQLSLQQSQTKMMQQTARNLGLLKFGQGISGPTKSLLTGFDTVFKGNQQPKSKEE